MIKEYNLLDFYKVIVTVARFAHLCPYLLSSLFRRLCLSSLSPTTYRVCPVLPALACFGRQLALTWPSFNLSFDPCRTPPVCPVRPANSNIRADHRRT